MAMPLHRAESATSYQQSDGTYEPQHYDTETKQRLKLGRIAAAGFTAAIVVTGAIAPHVPDKPMFSFLEFGDQPQTSTPTPAPVEPGRAQPVPERP